MASKFKLLFAFAIIGFFVGSAAYAGIEWLIENNWLLLTWIPLLQIVNAPWLMSGIAGAVLSLVSVVVFAHFSSDR